MITNILASLLISNSPVQVAVIDTGYSYNSLFNATLCKDGHKDFTDDQKYENGVPVDEIGHGSNVAGLIHQRAVGVNIGEALSNPNEMQKLKENNLNYCLIIVKAFSRGSNVKSYIKSLEYVKSLKSVKLVNISAGGKDFDSQEDKLIKEMLDDNKIIIAAAGNEGNNLDINNFYPASNDPRIVVVGNSSINKVQETDNKGFSKVYATEIFKAHNTSNFGSKIDVYAPGVNSLSLGAKGRDLSVLTGTSQATAVFTGLIINDIISNKLTSKQARKNERNP